MKKICVYAICKNEETFAESWVESMSEADVIVVLDTGSTDRTVELLSKHPKVQVCQQIIRPWRFDVARNACLDLTPEDADILICTDLDERFERGWRADLEAHWTDRTTRASYRYTWNFLPDGREGVVFWIDKIHSRKDHRWVHPVHEVLHWTGSGEEVYCYPPNIRLYHHADPAKSRAQYLPLLELSVREDPLDDRNMHYLGREYLFRGEWEKCIETLQKHLLLPTARWADERAASMRYIAKSLTQLGDSASARSWLLRAVAEAPHLREPYLDLALLLARQKEWEGCLWLCKGALKIETRSQSYINEAESWGALPFDLAAFACYHLDRPEEAVAFASRALEQEPDNERLKRDLDCYRAALTAQQTKERTPDQGAL